MAAAAGNTFYFDWEVLLEIWLQSHLPAPVLSLISFFSAFGEETLMILLLGLIYWCLDKEMGRYIGLNAIMGMVWHSFLKNIFLRRRPYFDNRDIQLLRPIEKGADIYDIEAQGYSFPSGHSTNGAAVYGSLARCMKKKWVWILALVLAFLIGFSRVVVGAHYPTDVLAGWTMGAVTILLVPALEKRIPDRRIFYGILLLTGVPGLFIARSRDFYTGFGLLLGFALADLFERRYVNFEKALTIPEGLLRLAGGGLAYGGLNLVLKKLIGLAGAAEASKAAYLFRTCRYTVIIFVLLGCYPLCFKKLKEALGGGKGREADKSA